MESDVLRQYGTHESHPSRLDANYPNARVAYEVLYKQSQQRVAYDQNESWSRESALRLSVVVNSTRDETRDEDEAEWG